MSLMPILRYRYIVTREKEAEEYRLQRSALRTMRNTAYRAHGIYSVSFGDERVKATDDLDEAIAFVKERLRKRRLGDRITLRTVVGENTVERVTAHVAAVRLEPADTAGVENIDRVVAAVDEFWPKRRYAGICVCKPRSDHADCAAVDWFDTAASMAAARDYFLDHAGIYGIKYIILFDRIYSDAYGFQPRPYTGFYHSHVHASVYGGFPDSAC